MISRLRFANFKSWARADVQFAPITTVFGTNSSGKTSLLQLLLLLKQTKDATDRAIALELNGDLVELGTMGDVLHNHDLRRTLEIDIEIGLRKKLSLTDPGSRPTATVADGDTLRMRSEVIVNREAPVARHLEYQLGDRSFGLIPQSGDLPQFRLVTGATGHASTPFQFTRSPGRPSRLPGPVKSYAFPDQARTQFQNAGFLADLEAAYEAALDRTYYLGPMRHNPQRDYLWGRSSPSDVGQRGEKTIDAILAKTEAGELQNLRWRGRLRPFQEVIAHWLRELGLVASFKIEELAKGSNRWQARVKTTESSSEVLLTDVGFGVSQVLPVVTLLHYVPEGSTVLLEQPELHLHPLAQAALADVIAHAALHRRVQVILESHSEHLLLRLQRRIAEGTVRAKDAKMYFCELDEGASQLTELHVDLYGNIRNWPPRFMGDAFGETAKAEIARLQRMETQG